ncbi:MAG: hypothetical protein ACKOW9_00290 [Candidatus Paceibacterota bacterium]
MSSSKEIDEIIDSVASDEIDFRKVLKEATNLDDETIDRVVESVEAGGNQPIAIDSVKAVAPENVNLPKRYRADEGSLSDDPIWSEHLKSHWGF